MRVDNEIWALHAGSFGKPANRFVDPNFSLCDVLRAVLVGPMDGAAKSAKAAPKASVIIFYLGVLPYFVNNRVQLCSFREPVYGPLFFPGS